MNMSNWFGCNFVGWFKIRTLRRDFATNAFANERTASNLQGRVVLGSKGSIASPAKSLLIIKKI